MSLGDSWQPPWDDVTDEDRAYLSTIRDHPVLGSKEKRLAWEAKTARRFKPFNWGERFKLASGDEYYKASRLSPKGTQY